MTKLLASKKVKYQAQILYLACLPKGKRTISVGSASYQAYGSLSLPKSIIGNNKLPRLMWPLIA
jgi:hypothetical protein